MTMPNVTVEIAFNAGYTTAAASRTWTDVTSYVEGQDLARIARGRGDEFTTVNPSTLALTLNNKDGRFTPEYVSGAYYPNVKKGRPIRVRVPALASDAFGRADSAVAIGTADVGGAWTALSGTWGISSGKAYCVTAADGNLAVLGVTATDVVVSAVVTVSGSAGTYEGVVARCTSASNYYLADVSEAGAVRLWKTVAGAFTQLGSTTAVGTMTAGQTLGLSCSGTTISALVNGTAVITQSDSALSTSTYCGVRNGGGSAAKRWDDFSVSVGGLSSTRFVGYIDQWPVVWPGGGDSFATVQITATSRMARLGRGSEFKSIVEEEILYDAPILYFPLGEPSGSTTAGNIAPGRTDTLTATQAGTGGTLTFGAGTGPGTDSLTAPILTPASVGNGLFLKGTLLEPVARSTDVWYVLECFFNTTTAALSVLVGLEDSGKNLNTKLKLGLDASGKLTATAAGSTSTSASVVSDGLTHHAIAFFGLSAGNIGASLYLDGVAQIAGTPQVYQATFPEFPAVGVGAWPVANTDLFTGTISHVALYRTDVSGRLTQHYNAGANGFNTEASGARVARYARLAGVPTAEIATETGLSTTIAHIDSTGQSPVELMQTVAFTEDGVVFDGKDGTLTFQGRSHRYASTSAFTLDASASEVGASFSPVLDDQAQTNDVTASRADGVRIRSVNQASIDEYGYYRQTVELVTTSDNEVQSRADWEVNRRGTPRVKVTSVEVDVVASTSAQAALLLAADIGTRFTITNLPAQAPSSTMDLFIEGITEEIGANEYRITFNTSAGAYANVWTLDSSTLSQLDSTTVLAY